MKKSNRICKQMKKKIAQTLRFDKNYKVYIHIQGPPSNVFFSSTNAYFVNGSTYPMSDLAHNLVHKRL